MRRNVEEMLNQGEICLTQKVLFVLIQIKLVIYRNS